jgi:hypothetical protein
VKRSKPSRKAAPPQSGAAFSGYTSRNLIERANKWASKHGYAAITAATFIELRREGIVPRPIRVGRGLGAGRGASWVWSAGAYCRLLRVIRLRAEGVTRRRDQRIRLFLAGSNIDINRIRRDLREFYTRNAKRIVREYGVLYATRGDRTPPKIAAEGRLLLDRKLVDEFLQSQTVKFPATVETGIRDVMDAPALAHIVDLMLKQSVLPDHDYGLPELTRQVSLLPAPVADAIQAELEESVSNLAGLLADPDLGNAIVDALVQLSDEELTVLRDYVLGWPAMLVGIKEAIATMLDDPHAVAIMALSGLLSTVGRSLSLRNPAMLLGFFIARTAVVPKFAEAAGRFNRMRPGLVLQELARRGRFEAQPDPKEMQSILASAGVSPEDWHYWLGNQNAS